MSDASAPSVVHALPGVRVDVMGMKLEAEVDWDLSDIPRLGP